jgi:hypothetical protein
MPKREGVVRQLERIGEHRNEAVMLTACKSCSFLFARWIFSPTEILRLWD